MGSSRLAVIDKDGNEQVVYSPYDYQVKWHASTTPNLLALGTRNTGKAIALDTILPSPCGYITMEALVVGDYVYDEQRQPTRIVWKSEPHIDPTGTYRLTFDDGSVIVCGGQHQWLTLSKYEAELSGAARTPRGSVSTTTEIAEDLPVCHRRCIIHSVDRAWKIVGAERIDNCLLQCIQVEAASHLYLVGKTGIPTHNSLMLRMDAILRCLMIPNFRALIVRRKMTDLRKSHLFDIPVEMKLLTGDRDHYVGSPQPLARFDNGSTISFAHCNTDADILDYLSSQYGYVGFDELSTFTLEQFLLISAAARAPKDAPYRAVVRAGSNPLGPGAEWMYRWFVEKTVDYADFPDYAPDDFEMQFSRLDQNKSADVAAYTKRLSTLPAHVRRAWLLGEKVVEGAYFMDFHKTTEDGTPWHVIETIPKWEGKSIFSYDWLGIYRSVDWGYYPDPAVCLWFAILPNHRVIVFKERTWRKTLAADVAKAIKKESEGMRIRETFADPTMLLKAGITKATGYSVGELFEQQGVPLTPSTNDRALYGYAIHDHLNTLIDGTPQLQIVAPQDQDRIGCPNLIRTLPLMQTDPNDPRKIADGEDHWCFVAGTLVTTEQGEKPIETVGLSDRVWTRNGWRPVKAVAKTADEVLVFGLLFDDNRLLIGTPAHPVWTQRGWVPLGELSQGDTCLSIRPTQSSRSSTEESRSGDTQHRKDPAIETTSGPAAYTSRKALSTFIENCGRMSMGLFQRSMTFITLMATRPIMRWRIWRASRPMNTSGSTSKRSTQTRYIEKNNSGDYGAPFRLRERLARLQRLENAIENPSERTGDRGSRKSLSASSAGTRSAECVFRKLSNIVQTPALPRDGELPVRTTKIERASSAVASLSTINIRYDYAVSTVTHVSPMGSAAVYNLAIADTPEYFANGILVHNCCALAYLAIGQAPPSRNPVVSAVPRWMRPTRNHRHSVV